MRSYMMYETDSGIPCRSAQVAEAVERLEQELEALEQEFLGPYQGGMTSGVVTQTHDVERVRAYHRRLSHLTRALLPPSAVGRGQEEVILHPDGVTTFLGRWGDAKLTPLSKVWGRLGWIDHRGQEWDQWYHAEHARRQQEAQGVEPLW